MCCGHASTTMVRNQCPTHTTRMTYVGPSTPFLHVNGTYYGPHTAGDKVCVLNQHTSNPKFAPLPS